MAEINYMDEQIRLSYVLERRLERFDHRMRKAFAKTQPYR